MAHRGGAKESHFQVKLGGEWKDYGPEEDKILKRAFMSGFPNAKFALRGQHYEYSFKDMGQKNLDTGKTREIRAPRSWRPPSAPVVPPGRTASVKVKKGMPGTTLTLNHPDGGVYTVAVPAGAKIGQTMLVPIPARGSAPPPVAAASEPEGKHGMSTGGKVAVGAAGAAVVGVGAVAGVMIAEHGLEGTGEILSEGAAEAGDALADAGEHIGEFAEEAGDWLGDAAESAGDFFMDLF